MKTFSEMRLENYITSLKRFFEDPDVEMVKLDVDMDQELKSKGIISFMEMVNREQKKGSITLLLVRDNTSTQQT